MGHLSLYRAFRPSTFDELVRQEHVVRILKNQIEGDAVGHAYLFCGPRGTGKTTVARIFARAVNCEHPVNGSPCGVCPTCKALADGGNLDVSEIDAASNNGVNEMRDLRDKVQYPPVSGKYKVYIIDEVHMLTDSAFNALLKTLEEPPRHAIFILATTEPHKIPATILSRCMRLDFKLIPTEDLENHLKRILDRLGKSYEDAAVSAIARAGAGSDRDMLSIAEMCLAYSEKLTYEGVNHVLGAADFSEMISLCSSILQADTAGALSQTEKILSEGKSVGVLLRDTLQLLNQIAVAKTCKEAERILSVPKDIFAQIDTLAKKADGHAILRATEIFSKTESELRFVSSPRICLETAIIKAATPAADYNLDALLARVTALEKQLAEGVKVAPSAASQPVPKAEKPIEQPQKKAQEEPQEEPEYVPQDDDWTPPMDEPIFDEPPVEQVKRVEKPKATPAPLSVPTKAVEEQKPERSTNVQADLSAETAFGKFMRTLRKTSRNGVLFTMCSDLEAVFEGDTLVLLTESETVFRSLGRDTHKALMSEVFAQIGVTSFEVRLKGQTQVDSSQGIEQLKRDFSDYPIEIK